MRSRPFRSLREVRLLALPELIRRLKRSEGWREHVYLDTTGNLTIAHGHALAKLVLPPGVTHSQVRLLPINGIPPSIGEALLLSDVGAAVGEVSKRGWTDRLDEVRREVLVELTFNVGPAVLGYPVFAGQLQRGEYKAAAANMRGWRWFRQVGAGRAEPLCKMMETGARP